MKLSDFDYTLPKELIAQNALSKRTEARLLILNRESGAMEHHAFQDIVDYFEKGDVLVLNDTKVLPARIFAKRKTGAKIEILLLKQSDASCHPERSEGSKTEILRSLPAGRQGAQNDKLFHDDIWTALIKPSGRVRLGEELIFSDDSTLVGTVLDSPDHQTGIRQIKFSAPKDVQSILSRIGHIPLPPYIDRPDALIDRELYQTVFAKRPGAVASPTAGLHFDEELLRKIEAKGVEILFVTLHVSYGTFQPVASEDLTQHQMYQEYFEISDETAERINFAKADGRRIIACGTTVVRTLESVATNSIPSEVEAKQGITQLFIYPPYEFKIVDSMITNFHLPRTTLLMLTGAFCGYDFLMQAYLEAIEKKYRFYSYGDAMFIL
ncbi:MAG: tRNA preQ1(34) S-adenosylmethionine ribosyltransferase-isomerase QueA [Omnitrophica bacterium RIFCSPHIGHO2_02_FULL_46_11]|nr:MAG: tRNA preQ1(34) S-adenosylmethionine ribosyltransferase-isomerase QueA [Omnitrophica bacterium RIFCSPHIGHO2_02_FULL_46_11]OGW87600.1 MAG: tRNA preQ1(34) S-adenosylmethionine ribosyltransferase-isomerase QueA [Omnitrophica bacterium RIFCSPLOWO2_01_FULL_45_10b]